MTFQLRDYQQDALNALFNYLDTSTGNPLIVLPTGAGKSIVVAKIFEELLKYSGTRGLCLTHVKELIVQNHSKMPLSVGAGIYSAGAKRRDVWNRIIFAGIQSVYKKANLFSPVNLVVIDEAHLLGPKQDTMYGKFLDELRAHNPNLRVIGLTATPYRSSGTLTSCTLFDDIAYELPMSYLIDEGYLATLKSKRGIVEADTSKMGLVAGEYNLSKMASEFDKDAITRAAVHEIVTLGANRNKWLVFCSSVEHCHHVKSYMDSYGVATAIITGDMDKTERELILKQYHHGVYKCLLNYGVLTTGFDEPEIDLLAMLRSTKSTNLYVQILGRGMRPVYASGFDLSTREGRFAAMAAGSKPNGCLVLDYGQNIVTHGPVDKIKIEKKYNPNKNIVEDTISCQPTKMCPNCMCDNHASATQCTECGYEYPIEVKHETVASEAAILSADIEPEWHDIEDVMYSVHKKAGKPDSLKVTYVCGIGVKSEWVCLAHEGYARKKAVKWWNDRASGDAPLTAQEAIARKEDIKRPIRISVKPEGKYERIVGYEDSPPVKEEPIRPSLVEDDEDIDWLGMI